MAKFKLITSAAGRSAPSGPLGAPTLAGGGGRKDVVRTMGRSGTKKGFTGSRAGVGRSGGAYGTVARSGPQGPRAFAGSVRLPNRQNIPMHTRHGAPTVQFKAYSKTPATVPYAPRPSLMTRIGRKLRSAAAFGF